MSSATQKTIVGIAGIAASILVSIPSKETPKLENTYQTIPIQKGSYENPMTWEEFNDVIETVNAIAEDREIESDAKREAKDANDETIDHIMNIVESQNL